MAFHEIKHHFGPDFEPLGADIYPSQPTPYGPATHYRTYSIAGIWMNYYMGLIVLHRAHPKMPPVAMLAAGMSAGTTMPWALKLCRIAAGLEENISHLKVVSTLMGAALIESAFPLFVAGVQVNQPYLLCFLYFLWRTHLPYDLPGFGIAYLSVVAHSLTMLTFHSSKTRLSDTGWSAACVT